MPSSANFSFIEQLKLQFDLNDHEIELLLSKGVVVDHLEIILRYVDQVFADTWRHFRIHIKDASSVQSLIFFGALIDLFVATKGNVTDFIEALTLIRDEMILKRGSKEEIQKLPIVQFMTLFAELTGELAASYGEGKSLKGVFR